MKQKVIDVKYRKDSTQFPKWVKYEITLLNEDGSTDRIPAYGKDLQDALSRVVHDKKVQKISKTTNSIPWWGWASIWFGYLGFISFWWEKSGNTDVLAGGILSAMVILVFVMLWSKDRNINKNG